MLAELKQFCVKMHLFPFAGNPAGIGFVVAVVLRKHRFHLLMHTQLSSLHLTQAAQCTQRYLEQPQAAFCLRNFDAELLGDCPCIPFIRVCPVQFPHEALRLPGDECLAIVYAPGFFFVWQQFRRRKQCTSLATREIVCCSRLFSPVYRGVPGIVSDLGQGWILSETVQVCVIDLP